MSYSYIILLSNLSFRFFYLFKLVISQEIKLFPNRSNNSSKKNTMRHFLNKYLNKIDLY